jgi:hypothetical protein
VFSELLDRFPAVGCFRDELHITFICRKSLYALAQHGVVVG